MNTISAVLCEFGFSELEARAYETAVGLGVFPASILGNRLGIPRSTARYTCESLVHKGLMIETKKANTKLFVAENPTKLSALFYTEEDRLMRKKAKLATTIKELQGIYNPTAKTPKVIFYEGIDGVERMLDDLLKIPKSESSQLHLCAFGAGDYFIGKEPDIVEKFRLKSLKKYKTSMIIRSPKYRNLYVNTERKDRYFHSIEELKVDIQIAEDTIAIVSLEHTSPIGLIIKHQDIVHAFRQIFMELWMSSDRDDI